MKKSSVCKILALITVVISAGCATTAPQNSAGSATKESSIYGTGDASSGAGTGSGGTEPVSAGTGNASSGAGTGTGGTTK